ncbi:MAG: hypothetical protein NTU48_07855 [Legionellales bacterium]|nr:hypothetical protein [Legionellales bacterium]
MPSYALAELSKQIELHPTDHFGKFYLYATLLNTITVRKTNFLKGMPVYKDHSACGLVAAGTQSFVGFLQGRGHTDTGTPINIGTINDQFSEKVSQYQSQYEDIEPSFVRSVQNIFLAFARKGQLSDLIFIIDKMHAHLNTYPMAQKQYNKSIHDGISFGTRKANVDSLLTAARDVTTHAQNSVDNATYGFGTIIAAMLAIQLTMALGGIFLTLVMLGIGACATFYFLQSAVTSFERIAGAASRCENLFNEMIKDQIEETYAPNNLNFIIKGVLAPIAYAGVTVQEQTASTDDEARSAAKVRKELDSEYASAEERSSLLYTLT